MGYNSVLLALLLFVPLLPAAETLEAYLVDVEIAIAISSRRNGFQASCFQ
jgi:hypothetical protein